MATDLTQKSKLELDELGYTILPNWIPEDLLVELRSRVADIQIQEGQDAGKEFKQEPGCIRLANLVDKGCVFWRVIGEPTLLQLVEHVLGPEFKLSSLNSRTTLPGCDLQPLHADMGGVADENGNWVCNVIWMLDAYTLTNGALRVVPGSHRWRKLPQEEMDDIRAAHDSETIVTAPAGSVVVLNAHTWHGGLANTSPEQRVALHAFYCRADKPQQQYQKRLLRFETQQQLPPDVRRLLALDDPRNDALSSEVVTRSGFLK